MSRANPQWNYRIIDQARLGRRQAKQALWRYLYASLPSWVDRSLSYRGVTRQDIEDALHEVLWRIMASIGRLRDPRSFQLYLFRITQHVARMYRARRQLELLDESIIEGHSGDFDLQFDVATALAHVPPRLARVVRLVYFEGYTYAEAAALLKCSQRSVKRALQSARTRLRVLLGAREAPASSYLPCREPL